MSSSLKRIEVWYLATVILFISSSDASHSKKKKEKVPGTMAEMGIILLINPHALCRKSPGRFRENVGMKRSRVVDVKTGKEQQNFLIITS